MGGGLVMEGFVSNEKEFELDAVVGQGRLLEGFVT